MLTALAGAGGTTASPTDKWLPEFDGGPATNALLSRPHIAMADRAGNVFIADKEAHAIRKVTPDGLIHTVAGNNVPGYGTTSPVPATSASLYNPNGLWVREDGGNVSLLGRNITVYESSAPMINSIGFSRKSNGLITYFAEHRRRTGPPRESRRSPGF